MVVFVPALTTGNGLTLTVITSCVEHTPLPTVTVYTVVTVGFATGFAMVVEFKPYEGVHE